MSRVRSLLLLTASVAVTGCATLGGNVKGDFACRAPSGTCRPMTAIDAAAIGQLGAGAEDGPAPADAPARGRAVTLTGPPLRTGERMLTILLPAHVDASGVLHDAATVHAVVEPAGWTSMSGTQTQTPFPEFSRSSAPSSLREAIAGASAPAIEGLEFPPRAPLPFQADGSALSSVQPAAPSAAAVAAARAGHRIGQGAPNQPLPGATVEPSAPVLPRGKVMLRQSDSAAAAAKVRSLAAPILARPAVKPMVPSPAAKSTDGDLGDPFGTTVTREQPR